MSDASLEQLHRENDEKAAREADAIKAHMRRVLECVLARMKERGEAKPSTTVDDLLREDAP